MSMQQTPSFIKSLLVPRNGQKPQGRKVWSIDLQQVWLPFFIATNTEGDTSIPPDALGAPLRLGYDKDGSVRFSKTGRPIMKVAKELGDNIRMVRENIEAGLVSHAGEIQTANPEGYANTLESAKIAGEPIATKDHLNLVHAQTVAMEKAVAEAEAVIARAKPKGKSKSRDHEGELVGASA